MTLKELIKEWLYENHQSSIKPRTLLRYETVLRHHIYPDYGDVDINNINPRLLQHWINDIKDKKSPYTSKVLSASSINTVVAIFHQAFKYAEEYEILDNNPSRKLRRMPLNKERKVKAFTREEQMRIERYIDSLHNNEYFVYILVLYTGLRLGEVMALTYKDINMKTGVISINKTMYKTLDKNKKWIYVVDTPKTKNSTREIPLPSFIKESLKELKSLRLSKYVVSHNDGSVLTDKVVVWRFNRLLKRIKVRPLNFHCLRHTFATRALENKMDIKTLSEILGHADITTTLNIYTHSLIDHKKSQMRKIKRLI